MASTARPGPRRAELVRDALGGDQPLVDGPLDAGRGANPRNPRRFDSIEGWGNFLTHTKFIRYTTSYLQYLKTPLRLHYELPKTL